MKELIEYLERKIELCIEMNMSLEKFAYTDVLKKARALQLLQTDVSMRSEQLKAFNKWFQENAPLYDYGIDETVIEDYLKSL